MCEFPSWIVDSKGQSWFLVDRDIKAGIDAGIFNYWEDAIGHSAIEKMFGVRGKHKEGREGLPKEFEQAIRDGKCNRMARTDLRNSINSVFDILPKHFFGSKIEGSLCLSDCGGVTELPDDLDVGADLSLRRCGGLTSLPNNLTVGRNLYLDYCKELTSITGNLSVGRDLFLTSCKKLKSLPNNLNIKRDLDLTNCTGLKNLPDGLVVGEDLNLTNCTGLTSLPKDLKVGGGLILRNCTGLTSLPKDLKVGGGLLLQGCTGLTSLPESLAESLWIIIPYTIKHIQREDGSLIDINVNNLDYVLEQLRAEALTAS